jgi:DNA topoisomerase-6 subunit B
MALLSKNKTTFSGISPSEFFYRNRDLAGFSNPAKALYTATRELVENSLDACESSEILPSIYVRMTPIVDHLDNSEPRTYQLKVSDNGPGIDPVKAPDAFGRVFYGSKYKLRQARGMFGMGGTMAVLYGQITTSKPVIIYTSTDGKKFHKFTLRIDIQKNAPVIINKEIIEGKGSTGTTVELLLTGDAFRASTKVHDYFLESALVTPYAEITFIDAQGKMFYYPRSTNTLPKPSEETQPHPHGFDFEGMRRLIEDTGDKSLHKLLMNNFHRVGATTSTNFFKFAKIDHTSSPKDLSYENIVQMVDAMHSYESFLPPDSHCLSPLGKDILNAGIMSELSPEFSTIAIRPPSAYSGFPFIVEVGLAYGGNVGSGGVKLFRYANRIPLLYDEGSDIAWQVVKDLAIDKKRAYKIPDNAPLALITHVCSTKVPFKTAGKEFLADRPEIERELKNAVREVLRKLRLHLSRKSSEEAVKRRRDIYSKYLPLIAEFSKDLSGKKDLPNFQPMLKAYLEESEGNN